MSAFATILTNNTKRKLPKDDAGKIPLIYTQWGSNICLQEEIFFFICPVQIYILQRALNSPHIYYKFLTDTFFPNLYEYPREQKRGKYNHKYFVSQVLTLNREENVLDLFFIYSPVLSTAGWRFNMCASVLTTEEISFSYEHHLNAIHFVCLPSQKQNHTFWHGFV